MFFWDSLSVESDQPLSVCLNKKGYILFIAFVSENPKKYPRFRNRG
jgi:hypothetical protein